MTSQGSPYARFRRALLTRKPHLIRAAAAELEQVGLADALEVCAVLADAPGERYERAAVRWMSRLCLEARPSLEELGRAVAALNELPLQSGPALEVLRPIARSGKR